MVLRKPIIAILIISTALLQSCNDGKVGSSKNNSSSEINDVSGTKHFLEDDGITIFLPEIFERYSLSEYEKVVDSLTNKTVAKLEIQRLQNVRAMDGNSYLFFAPDANASYLVNTIPYAPIRKQDAQKLLGIIRQNHKKAKDISNVTFTKVTAKFSAVPTAQIFKAVFKVEDNKTKNISYQHSYFISSNQKSVLLNLSVGEILDFDPYIKKMIF